ncbi:type II toxin-antitoxin system Phd/YefM family antitoxin [Pseudomonas sp. Xaverov 259]|uniref:type II toxin-antitoxin system Phd/YefM family antitoxin n=1 Tax=Pseudomonas sp. Xaverov 259 TaxID=2666086 RepID=UPI001C5A82A7|nr:type II toxin-antitoxin system prevent-host-death family antitoxin [Pseudomonas sp. Xaverov 259]
MNAQRHVITDPIDPTKAHVSKLAHQASTGQIIIITKNGCALAQPETAGQHRGQRIGVMKGKLTVPDDFDAPLPDEVLDTFQKALI